MPVTICQCPKASKCEQVNLIYKAHNVSEKLAKSEYEYVNEQSVQQKEEGWQLNRAFENVCSQFVITTAPLKFDRNARNHPLLSLRLSYWVIARSQLHGYLRPRKIGGYPCWWWVHVKRRVANERVFVKWPCRDIVIIEQWTSFGRRVFSWFSLLRLERRRLSTLSVDVLCPSARSNWSVVITALRLLYCRSWPKGPLLPITWLPLS